jgi:hypothetical protein
MGSLPLDSVCYDGPLLRRISELHVWAVREGLCGTAPATLFEGLCRRLAGAGVPLWRAVMTPVRRERPVVQPTDWPHGGNPNELFDGRPRRAARAFINFVPHG